MKEKNEHDDIDLNRPGVPGPSFFSDSGEEVPNPQTLRDNLIDLTNRYGREIPPDVLDQYEIAGAEYVEWLAELDAEEARRTRVVG